MMMANIAVVAGNYNVAAGAAAAIAAETTSSQVEEDRALLNRWSASADSWNAFDELKRSGPFARTLGRLQVFVDERIGQLATFHPDDDALHEDIGFQYLHDRYVRRHGREIVVCLDVPINGVFSLLLLSILFVHVYYIYSFAEWAIAVRQGDYEAFDRTLDRRAIRDVLLRLWDFLCKDQRLLAQHMDGPLAAWMIEVLRTVLPMERADCLFNMKYNDSGLFGMPWISKLHKGTGEHREWQTWIRQQGGQPAMNRRFVEIVEHLKKHQDEYDYNRDDMKLIERLLVPTMPDGLPMDLSLLLDDWFSQYYTADRRADRALQREKVHDATTGADTIQDFTAIYKSTAFMKHVHVLHTLSNDQNLYDFANEWAAHHINKGDEEVDDAEKEDDKVQDEDKEEDETAVMEFYFALDEFVPADLWMILCFYEKLSGCLQDVDNHSVTHDSVVAQLKIQSLANVLGIAFALGRSWAVATNRSWPALWMVNLCNHAFAEDEPNLQNLHPWLAAYVPMPTA
jgi:hypothetical protein